MYVILNEPKANEGSKDRIDTMHSVIVMLVMFATILGPSMVIAAIGFASVQALGRNPSAAPKILMAMIVALIFAEAIAVIALLVLFQLFGNT